jgi:hypothetical protein
VEDGAECFDSLLSFAMNQMLVAPFSPRILRPLLIRWRKREGIHAGIVTDVLRMNGPSCRIDLMATR